MKSHLLLIENGLIQNKTKLRKVRQTINKSKQVPQERLLQLLRILPNSVTLQAVITLATRTVAMIISA